MKKMLALIVISLTLISCSTTEVKDSDTRNYASKSLSNIKKVIRVDNFENKTIYGEGRFTQTMHEAIKSEASSSNKFQVLARDASELSSIKSEVSFSAKNGVKHQKLRKGMNLKEAQFALSGALTSFSVEQFTQNGMVSQKKIQKTTAKVELKLMNLYTGELDSFPGEAVVNIERGTTLGKGQANSTYSQREEDAVRKAMIDAMNKVVRKMDESAWSIKGTMVNGKVYLPVGKASNLKLGTTLKIYKQGEPVMLDDEIVGYEQTELGKVKVKMYMQGREGSICEFVGEQPSIKSGTVTVSL